MVDNYSKRLYNQLNSIDPSYGKDVPFSKFQSSIKDKNYANRLYNQLSAIDPSYKKDVSFDKFYSSVNPQEEKGFLSKAWENITSGQGIFGKSGAVPLKPGYKSEPSIVEKWFDSFLPSQEEKKDVTKDLQNPPFQKEPALNLDPISKAKKDNDEIINPFKEFRKFVPDPTNKSDSLNVGFDLDKFLYEPTRINVPDPNNPEGGQIQVPYINQPKNLDKPTLKSQIVNFKKEKEDEIKRLNAERSAKLSNAYQEGYSKEKAVLTPLYQKQVEVDKINAEYDQKIKNVEKAYKDLDENIFQNLLTKVQNEEQFSYRFPTGKTLQEEKASLERSKAYTESLNNQEKNARLRDAAEDVIESENIDNEKNLQSTLDRYYASSNLFGEAPSPNFVTANPLSKESKEYKGTVKQLAINKNVLENYSERKKQLVDALEKNKANLEKDLQENVYSKGYKISDLTPESQNQIAKQEQQFEEMQAIIDLYDVNIDLANKRNNILLSDIGSFKEFINYRAEQEKINRLYQENPLTTFTYSFAKEFGTRLGSSLQTASTLNILAQKKLGNISSEEADFYLKTIPEVSERNVYVQKLVEDKETGQMVYKNLKDVESVSIFNEKGEYKPIGDWVENWDALGYTMLNTTAESAMIGFTGLAVRKGLYQLGKAATTGLATELGVLEAIDASTVGLSNLNKAKLLGLQGLKKSAVWTADVSSMVPATTVLYSPEIIKTEIDKGLSVEDVASTASLRLLAENVAENLFFDDVKFIDNLLKSGTVKNFTELSRSEAYKLLMDKVSIATVGRGLSNLEFKALFTGKGLKNLLSKENYQYLLKRSLPEKTKYLTLGVGYGLETSGKESGEEVATNLFNNLIDTWRQSEDESYKPDQAFTIENQVNTVIQTMASMLLLGGSSGYQQAKQKGIERKYNIDLAAYNVSLNPNIFKENLYNQYAQSQKTQNPMSNDELSLRMSEIDRLSEIYKSLGFSDEKTKENVKKELEKLTAEQGLPKEKITDLISNELLKQAEKNVRNTEFQTFREALTQSELQNAFVAAKTEKEKLELAEKIDKSIEKIQDLKDQRRIQQDNFIKLQKEEFGKEYDQQRKMLSNIVENIDDFVGSLNSIDELQEVIDKVETYQDVSDEAIKAYYSIINVALKNKQYELLSKGEKGLTPQQLEEKKQFELNNFNDTENKIIESLRIDPSQISKRDGKIVYNYEGQEVEFENFKSLNDFNLAKQAEKQAEIEKKQAEEFENNYLKELEKISKYRLYKTSDNKYAIENPDPNEEDLVFNSIQDLETYLLNPESEEEKQQNDLNEYESKVDLLYEEYKKSLKKPLPKDRWLKTKAAQKLIQPLKRQYGIKEDLVVLEDTLAVTYAPLKANLKTEFTEEDVTTLNHLSNLQTISAPDIIYLNTQLVSASNLIAYQARTFTERTVLDEENNIYEIEESTNELNKEFLFLHSPTFNTGQEFVINIKSVETSENIENEKEALKQNASYLIKQGISEQEINTDLANDEMFREIQIFTTDGKYVGAIHSLSYIRPDRVVKELTDESGVTIDNLAPNYKQLKALRNTLLSSVAQGKNVKLVLSSKSSGWLSVRVNNEIRPIKEAFKNSETLKNIQVLPKTSKLRIKGKDSVNEGLQGSTVVPIITPANEYFVLTLNKAKLTNIQIDNFIQAIELHALYNRLINIPSTDIKENERKAIENLETLSKLIQKDTEFDILTPEGLKEYLQLFVNVNSKTKDYYTTEDKELVNVPFIDVDKDENGKFRITFSNQRIFEGRNPTLAPGSKEALNSIGIYRFTIKDFENGISLLREHLQKRTVNHSTELIQKNKSFKLVYLKKTNNPADPYMPMTQEELGKEGLSNYYSNYKDFVLSTSLTSIIETETGDGNYTYFQQPNLSFSVTVTEKEEEQPSIIEEEEAAPAPEVQKKEVKFLPAEEILGEKERTKPEETPPTIEEKPPVSTDAKAERREEEIRKRGLDRLFPIDIDETTKEGKELLKEKEAQEKAIEKLDAELAASEGKKEEVKSKQITTEELSSLDQDAISLDDTSLEYSKNFLEQILQNNMELKDGNVYTYSEITDNPEMLEEMGYTPEEIGEIFKKICNNS